MVALRDDIIVDGQSGVELSIFVGDDLSWFVELVSVGKLNSGLECTVLYRQGRVIRIHGHSLLRKLVAIVTRRSLDLVTEVKLFRIGHALDLEQLLESGHLHHGLPAAKAKIPLHFNHVLSPGVDFDQDLGLLLHISRHVDAPLLAGLQGRQLTRDLDDGRLLGHVLLSDEHLAAGVRAYQVEPLAQVVLLVLELEAGVVDDQHGHGRRQARFIIRVHYYEFWLLHWVAQVQENIISSNLGGFSPTQRLDGAQQQVLLGLVFE